MERTVAQTAGVLMKIYCDQFKNDCIEMYRISWPQLRLISGQVRLDRDYISALNMSLIKDGYTIVTLDNCFVVAHENDFKHDREVPDRIIDKYLELQLDEEDIEVNATEEDPDED